MLKLAFKTTRHLAHFAALAIILLAVVVVVTRLLTPVFDSHRADFERWATEVLQAPVTIQSVHASWYGYQPAISLHRVTILNKDTRKPALQIERVKIFFSVFRSLWNWRPVTNGVVIAGTELQIAQASSGEISIVGSPLGHGFQDQPFQQESKVTDILAWLSVQPNVVLRDIYIRFQPATGEKMFFTLTKFKLENAGREHNLSGQGILRQKRPLAIKVVLQWQGEDIKNFSDVEVQGYLSLDGVALVQWLKDRAWYGWEIKQGLASAKIWAEWSKGKWEKWQTTFTANGLELHSQTDNSRRLIQRFSGHAAWKRDGENYIMAGEDILIDFPDHVWPATHFYVSLSPDPTGTLMPNSMNLSYVNLTDLQSWIFSSPAFLPDTLREILVKLHLKGDLQNVKITGQGTDFTKLNMTGNFIGLSFFSWQKWPAVSNLTGILQWSGNKGTLTLNSQQTTFEYNTIFANPVKLDSLTGQIELAQGEQESWHLQANGLRGMNQDIDVQINGSLASVKDSAPMADISARFSVQQVKHIATYLPMRIFDAELVNWLQHAFKNGRLTYGRAVLQGPLSEFPFDSGKGSFLISGVLENVDFYYGPGWPPLLHTNGRVTFSGRKMVAEVNTAQLLDIPVTQVQGVIPYLGDDQPQVVEIQSKLTTDFSKGMDFVQKSPLQNTIGKQLAGATLQGPVILGLQLSIPLKNPEQAKVQGEIMLTDSSLLAPDLEVSLEHIKGMLRFTEDTMTAFALDAYLFNQPITLTIATQQSPGAPALVRAKFASRWSVAQIEKWLKIPLSPRVQGASDFQVEMDFFKQAPTLARVRTNLLGVSINLPEQYGKKSEETRDFTAELALQTTQPLQVNLTYGDLNAALVLEKSAQALHVVSGELRAEKMNILNQPFTQARLKFTPMKNSWSVNITSREAAGDVQVPMNFPSQETLTANFTYLNLAESNNTSKLAVDRGSLPPISFTAERLRYRDMNLGKVVLQTQTHPSGVAITALRITSAALNLQASGEWGATQTSLKGTAESSSINDLLAQLNIHASNFFASTGKFDFDLNWPGAPYTPTLGQLAGKVQLKVGKGRIEGGSETSGAKMDIGRMLSLFSLQSLPRRLSLDFSDLFGKGYSFDSLRGTLNLRAGSAYTNDTEFDGSIARVALNGRIGLRDKDYDMTLSITPYVTSSIPLAATLTMGPAVGLAALMVNQVIGSQISKVATHYYEVTGSWDHPNWKSVHSPR